MANRNFDQGYTIGKRLIEISGSFVAFNTNYSSGSNPVTASTVKGYGFGYAPNASGVMTLQPNVNSKSFLTTTPGILRTAQGTYTITLEDPYLDVNDVGCDLALASGNTSGIYAYPIEPVANLGSSTAAIVLTIVLANSGGSLATETNISATNRVYFSMVLRDSTTQRVKP